MSLDKISFDLVYGKYKSDTILNKRQSIVGVRDTLLKLSYELVSSKRIHYADRQSNTPGRFQFIFRSCPTQLNLFWEGFWRILGWLFDIDA